MTVIDGEQQSASQPLNENHPKHDPYAALRYRDFQLLFIGRVIATIGEQMLSVAIGWELFERTNSDLAVGIVGLVQVIPVIVLALPAGTIIDRVNRKRLVALTQILLAICSVLLAVLSHTQGSLVLVYLALFGIGVSRSFNNPATAALLPATIPPEAFTSAATWSSSSWQLASVIGPAIGGLMIAVFKQATPVYIFDAIAATTFMVAVALIKGRDVPLSRERPSLRMMAAGASFIWHNKVILACITLDMFAVLLGGATALLPDYTKNILHSDATGLGLLRAAPSVGALLMAFSLAHLPPIRRAGITLLLAVAGFGAATIVFSFSTSFWLSMISLLILGALDNISVVIRSTLFLTRTPDEMRGRVNAVNGVFIGASNELGQFESGAASALVGPVWAVALGGIGAVVVVGLVAVIWPEVRALGRLGDPD
jgi:MFS family permease